MPLVEILPVTCNVLSKNFKLVDAVAALVVPSDNIILPTPGLLMVLNPVPAVPLDPAALNQVEPLYR